MNERWPYEQFWQPHHHAGDVPDDKVERPDFNLTYLIEYFDGESACNDTLWGVTGESKHPYVRTLGSREFYVFEHYWTHEKDVPSTFWYSLDPRRFVGFTKTDAQVAWESDD